MAIQKYPLITVRIHGHAADEKHHAIEQEIF